MPTYKDYSGKKFGNWTILKRILPHRPAKYLCKCDCGKESEVFLTNLIRGYSNNCRDCQSLKPSAWLVGKKLNHLNILAIEKINNKATAKVLCDCGNLLYMDIGKIQKHEGSQITSKYIACGKCKLSKPKIVNFNIIKVGFKKGTLTVIKELNKKESLALCSCGNEKIIKFHHMKREFPHCGCLLTQRNIDRAKKLEGTTYFYLKVIKFLGMGSDKRSLYLIKCKCGKKFEQSISYLFGSKSCGCLHKENVPRGSNNSNSKLTEIEVKSMRNLYESGLYTRVELSKMYEVELSNVCNIISRKGWKHV
jgi:hypothetical protein